MRSFAFSLFKLNYHQEQLDGKGIIIMRGVHRVKVCNGSMVTSFVPFFLFFFPGIGKIMVLAAARGARKSGAHHAGYLS